MFFCRHSLYRVFAGVLLFFLLPVSGWANELILEPIIQKHPSSGIVHAIEKKGIYYINFEEIADQLHVSYTKSKGYLSFSFMEKKHTIHLNSLSKTSYLHRDGRLYFSVVFYEKLLPLRIKVLPLDMQLNIDSNEILPSTQKRERERRQAGMLAPQEQDAYTDYDFDNRPFAYPVIDLSYGKAFLSRKDAYGTRKNTHSDSYQIDAGFLLAGLDTSVSLFGNSEQDNFSPRGRLTMGRTLLDEPINRFNLKTFEFGDVQAFNGSFFTSGNHGRGVTLSSFKDLVLSADKTIDITGYAAEGWETELYLNNQLIGFKRQSINGQYAYNNIPVSYGLNAFKVVFYGPYGETRSEEKYYYSGTSPVKTGEFGYTFNSYQKNRYLFESNEPFASPSNRITTEATGYYGLTDHMTLIAGISHLTNELSLQEQTFTHTGIQFIFAGASFQYNLMNNLTDQKTGHHFETQGNIRIGDIFVRYDLFDNLHSPISFYNNRFLKDQFEGRLTGNIPFDPMPLPYFISYKKSRDHLDWNAQEVQMRVSPNFMRYYTFSIESLYYKDQDQTRNSVFFMLQAQYDNFGVAVQSRYQIRPESSLQNIGLNFDYRWDRNTFIQADWMHEYNAGYTRKKELDIFTLSTSRLFSFGGLQLSISADTSNYYTAQLTYNISLGKVPERTKFFTDSKTTMTKNAALHISAVDEAGRPMSAVRFYSTSWAEPFVTGQDGSVLISDLQPYQKTILRVDTDSLDDISLVPEFLEKKVVLRPGTVYPIRFVFTHKGEFEGQIINNNRPFLYKVFLLNMENKLISSKIPSKDGSFIMSNIPFGQYHLIIKNKENQIVHQQKITINKAFSSLIKPILIKSAPKQVSFKDNQSNN